MRNRGLLARQTYTAGLKQCQMRQEWLSSEARHSRNPTPVISIPTSPHPPPQFIWQQTTLHFTRRQNQTSHFRNHTLGPLDSQDPKPWVVYKIAHLSIVATWETRGTEPTVLTIPLAFPLSVFLYSPERMYLKFPSPDSSLSSVLLYSVSPG